MSSSSGFLHAIVSPVSYTYEGLSRLCCKIYLDKVAEIAFRFFSSYGDSPKDLAKALQVLGSWTVVICDKKGASSETARKVSDFAKQAKCFMSLASLPKQFSKTTGMYSEPSTQEASARSFGKMVSNCTGLYSSIFDSVSLLSSLGFVSPKTSAFKSLQLGNSFSTILGACQRLGDDAYQLRKREVTSAKQWQNTLRLIGNLAVLALGALPLLSGFKNSNAFTKNFIMLRLSTVAVITNLLDKHIAYSCKFSA